MLVPCFAIQYFLSFLVLQSSRCFPLLVFLQSCGCSCSVSLPRGARFECNWISSCRDVDTYTSCESSGDSVRLCCNAVFTVFF